MKRCLFLLAIVAGASGCRRPDDEDLGIARARTRAVALTHLTDPSALLDALQQPGATLDARLGPHGFDLLRGLELGKGRADAPVDRIDDVVRFDADGKGAFHVCHDLDHPLALVPGPAKESADLPRDKIDPRAQGMEAIAVPGRLFVRSRFGRYVERRAEPGELDRLRELGEQLVADDLELLQASLAVSDGGETTIAGRRTRRLILGKGAARTTAKDDEPRKAWRQGIDVSELKGELSLDAETGALVAASLDARFHMRRDDGELSAHLFLTQTPRAAHPITPATDALVGPRRPRPTTERNQLLEGLAPAGAQSAGTHP